MEIVLSKIRFFADNTFIFRVADQQSTQVLNSDLEKIISWAWDWKMLFNPDISKQALEVIFSNNKTISTFDPLVFNTIPVKQVIETMHIGMILDNRLNFESHIAKKIPKANQGLGILKQLKK